MSNRPLGRCPTCKRDLDDETREAMGLRNGELLNSMCPGRNGPSDIDHVLHNMHPTPERVIFIEYKNGAFLTRGQELLHGHLTGDWSDDKGRRISIRFKVVQEHDPKAQETLQAVTNWVWPETSS